MNFYLVSDVDVDVGLQQALYTIQVTPVRRPQQGIQSILKKTHTVTVYRAQRLINSF